MPSQLDRQQRLEQVGVKREVFAEVESLWPLLDFRRLGRTFGPWLEQMGGMIGTRRGESADLARAYVLTSKEEAGVPGRLELPATRELLHGRLVGNLLVDVARAGRIAKAKPGSVQAEHAARSALVRAQGTAQRLAVEAGRQVVVDVVDDAPRLLDAPARRDLEQRARRRPHRRNPGPRWYRTISGNACKFCAMLAGRGAVYREDSVAFRSHDHCACGAGLEWE